MLVEQKEKLLHLPVKLLFTNKGIEFFVNHKKKLNRFSLADGSKAYGVFMKEFTPSTLQNMMLQGFISNIEITAPDLFSRRNDVMDMTKLLFFTIKYEQFDRDCQHLVLNSQLIQLWNSQNPDKALGVSTQMDPRIVRAYLDDNKNRLKQLKRSIAAPLASVVREDNELLLEEKNIQLFIVEKFLNRINPLSWFILLSMSDNRLTEILKVDLSHLLRRFIGMNSLPEYFSLMLLELLADAETTNLKGYIESTHPDVSVSSIMEDPERRQWILDEMRRDNVDICISWKLVNYGRDADHPRRRMQISLYNKETEFLQFRSNLSEGMDADTDQKSLYAYYKMPEVNNSNLGLFYLSYLNNACKQANIGFQSLVRHLKSSDMININFQIDL